MTKETGGPAFPRVHPADVDGSVDIYHGMTLRDYFAAKAMQGLLAADTAWSMPAETVAELAYEQADAMLEARK
jgi:hypothetical protein